MTLYKLVVKDVATDTNDLVSCFRKDVGTQTEVSDLNVTIPPKYEISVLEKVCGSTIDDSDVDSDETRLDTPEKDFDPDATLDYSYKASDKEVDSDATRLDTPQSREGSWNFLRAKRVQVASNYIYNSIAAIIPMYKHNINVIARIINCVLITHIVKYINC